MWREMKNVVEEEDSCKIETLVGQDRKSRTDVGGQSPLETLTALGNRQSWRKASRIQTLNDKVAFSDYARGAQVNILP